MCTLYFSYVITIKDGAVTDCRTLYIIAYLWQLVLKLAFFLPEDVALVAEDVGYPSLLFMCD